MAGRRGRFILAGYPQEHPDLVCVRALDRGLACKLTVGPAALPADLRGPSTLALDSDQALSTAEDVWERVTGTLERGDDVLRWYSDNPLATPAGQQDASDLREADVNIEIVPMVPVEITALTFAGIPLPQRPRSTAFAGCGGETDLTVLHGDGASDGATASEWIIDQPGAPRQRSGTHGYIDSTLNSIGFSGPAVARRFDPNWYESLPLFGYRILVTRTLGQAALLSRTLRNLGAEPVELPAIDIVPNPYPEQTERATHDLPGYDWVIFTSANGVEVFMDSVRQHGYDARRFGAAKVAAIGVATAERLRRHFIEPDFVPEEFIAEAVLSGLRQGGVAGKRVLIPRAEVARSTLPDGLRESGATVDVVPVYRTVPGTPDPEVLEQIDAGAIDIITFTSSSTVTNLLAMLEDDPTRLSETRVACIGPITASTAREHGLSVDIIAEEYSVPGMVNALCTALEEAA